MNSQCALFLACVAIAFQQCSSLGAFSVIAGGTTVAALSAPATIAAILALKGALLGGILLGRARGRRDTSSNTLLDKEDATFSVLASMEPAQCYHRLICDLATGAIDAPDGREMVAALTSSKVSPKSPKFEFSAAARFGQMVKDVSVCELRYSCPVSGEELAQFL